ncbi:hypothetical protein Esti_003537 [Eimeria stiedai]
MSKSLVAATSAALAACASTLVVYPLDTLLVHHQASASKQPRKLLLQQHKQHRTLVQALVDVLHELLHQEENSSRFHASQKQQPNKDRLAEFLNGIGRLYSGLGVKLAEQVARNFVYFYLYQALKSRAAKSQVTMTTVNTLLLAVLAAFGTQLLTAPLDVTSTHAQLCRLPLRTIFMRILRTEGPLGFYRGFGASLCLCANPAITNATFDSLKVWLQMVNLLRARRFMDPITDDDTQIEQIGQVLPPLSGLQTFLLGAVSKAVATVATYPYIRAKVLLQARLLDRAANMHVEPVAYPQAQQELALISGGTGASAAPCKPVGAPSSRASKAADSGSRELPRAGSMEPQQVQQLQQLHQLQQEPTVPRTMSAQSALHKEAPGQVSGALAPSAYICSHNLRKPASFCLSDCSEAGGLGICGSSDDGSGPSSDNLLEYKPRGPPSLSDPEAEGGVVAVLVSSLMQEGFHGLYRGLGLQLLKTILAASILYLIKEKLQTQTAHAFARVDHVFGAPEVLLFLKRWVQGASLLLSLRGLPGAPGGPSGVPSRTVVGWVALLGALRGRGLPRGRSMKGA